jgi:hypothetical protein
MERFINTRLVIAAQMTTPAENPLVTDNNRLMDVWFGGGAVRKQMFKKVTKDEQEVFQTTLLAHGFIRSGNLLFDPGAILFAEMENQLLGGMVTLGFGENGKPVELKVSAQAFADLHRQLNGS